MLLLKSTLGNLKLFFCPFILMLVDGGVSLWVRKVCPCLIHINGSRVHKFHFDTFTRRTKLSILKLKKSKFLIKTLSLWFLRFLSTNLKIRIDFFQPHSFCLFGLESLWCQQSCGVFLSKIRGDFAELLKKRCFQWDENNKFTLVITVISI